jgi:hypothetical protein
MRRSRSGRVALAVGVAGLMLAAVPTITSNAATSAPAAHQSGTAGVARSVTPRHSESKPGHGVRPIPRAGAAARSSVARPVDQASHAGAGGRVLRNFDGVGSLDSEVTNFNAMFEPPDQGLCTGNGFVLEPVNSAYRIYRPDGTNVRGPFNVNDLFNEGSEEFTSDPRCYFDATTNTWFAAILFLNADFTQSHLDVAVNPSGDPTSLWTEYQFDTTDAGGPGCPCFGDQPLLGIDQDNIYVSSNEFSILGPEFNGAEILAISKADLVARNPDVHFVNFPHLTIAGDQAASVQPAISTGAPAAEFFLSSLDPQGTGDNRIGVWAMTDREAVATGGTPTLTNTVITSEPYANPPAAEQKGSASTLDSGDDRMQQAQSIGGSVWGELGTVVDVPGDPTPRAGAAWFQVSPTLTGNAVTGATIVRQGYVSQRNGSLLYPALQADAAGRAAMVFTSTGRRQFPSAAFATLGARDTSFGRIRVTGAGIGPYDPNATRWGDYSFAVLDPGGEAVWLATEYIPPKSSQTSNGRRNWGTRVFEVSLG